MSNPDEIRRDIENTRAELSDNVNALEVRGNPANIARGQVDKVKGRVNDLKENVFGSPDDPSDDGMAGEAADRISGAVDDTRQAVANAPRQVKNRTRGNPIAAGLIAAGVGALIGGLIPTSRVEQQTAQDLKEAAEPLAEEVKGMAQDAAQRLQPKAQEAAESVGQVAMDAVDTVKAEASQAADTVTDEAKEAGEKVKADAQGAAQETRDDVDTSRQRL